MCCLKAKQCNADTSSENHYRRSWARMIKSYPIQRRGARASSLPREPRENRRPWWTHACCSSSGGLSRRRSGRPRRGSAPASGGRRPRERTIPSLPPWGGRCFKYRPPLGSSRPSNMDCAVRIIQKSPPICSLSPSLDIPATRRPRVAPASRR